MAKRKFVVADALHAAAADHRQLAKTEITMTDIIIAANQVRIDGFEPKFSGSDKQKAWASQIAKTALNQLAALTAVETQKRLRLGWSEEDIVTIKAHVEKAVEFAQSAAAHRAYAGWWIKNRSYGPSLFKKAWE